MCAPGPFNAAFGQDMLEQGRALRKEDFQVVAKHFAAVRKGGPYDLDEIYITDGGGGNDLHAETDKFGIDLWGRFKITGRKNTQAFRPGHGLHKNRKRAIRRVVCLCTYSVGDLFLEKKNPFSEEGRAKQQLKKNPRGYIVGEVSH